MKKVMQWALAAALLISGPTVFTSCSIDDNPVKRERKMMLVGREFTDMPYFGTTIDKYTYDDEYRLVNMKTVQVSTGEVLSNLDYIYTPGHITKKGQNHVDEITDECRLDDQGRIVEYHNKCVNTETGKVLADDIYTFTYDENGHLATMHTANAVETYTWEGDELRSSIMIENNTGYLLETYEPSDAPAQTFFNWYGYKVPELCLQGCFGVLPAHMPAKQSIVMYLSDTLNISYDYEYKYTTVDGRLATVTVDQSNYILYWELI
jgi:YD repeat-containing protein